MKKLLLLALCLVLIGTGGCANIQNDGTRTTVEGGLTGAAVGAGIGAIVGAIAGGGDGALIGAGIGAAVGGLAGTVVGKHIADKKSEYASREDWLDACIVRAKTTNEQTLAYNNNLRQEITTLDKQSTKLAADFKRKRVSTETMHAENKAVQKRRTEVEATIAQLEKEVGSQKTVVADARANKNPKEADIIEREIVKMEKEIAQLKQTSAKLAAISVRISV